jgi:hypothetical protein
MAEHRGEPLQTAWVKYPEPHRKADDAEAIDAMAKAASDADAAANADGAGEALYDYLAIVAPAPLLETLDDRDPDPT